MCARYCMFSVMQCQWISISKLYVYSYLCSSICYMAQQSLLLINIDIIIVQILADCLYNNMFWPE